MEKTVRMRPVRVLRVNFREGNPLVYTLNRGAPTGLGTSRAKHIATIRDYVPVPRTVPLKMKNPGGLPVPGDIIETMDGTRVIVKSINDRV